MTQRPNLRDRTSLTARGRINGIVAHIVPSLTKGSNHASEAANVIEIQISPVLVEVCPTLLLVGNKLHWLQSLNPYP